MALLNMTTYYVAVSQSTTTTQFRDTENFIEIREHRPPVVTDLCVSAKMRRIQLVYDDAAMFSLELSQPQFDFFQGHEAAFRRMYEEQVR